MVGTAVGSQHQSDPLDLHHSFAAGRICFRKQKLDHGFRLEGLAGLGVERRSNGEGDVRAHTCLVASLRCGTIGDAGEHDVLRFVAQ